MAHPSLLRVNWAGCGGLGAHHPFGQSQEKGEAECPCHLVMPSVSEGSAPHWGNLKFPSRSVLFPLVRSSLYLVVVFCTVILLL